MSKVLREPTADLMARDRSVPVVLVHRVPSSTAG